MNLTINSYKLKEQCIAKALSNGVDETEAEQFCNSIRAIFNYTADGLEWKHYTQLNEDAAGSIDWQDGEQEIIELTNKYLNDDRYHTLEVDHFFADLLVLMTYNKQVFEATKKFFPKIGLLIDNKTKFKKIRIVAYSVWFIFKWIVWLLVLVLLAIYALENVGIGTFYISLFLLFTYVKRKLAKRNFLKEYKPYELKIELIDCTYKLLETQKVDWATFYDQLQKGRNSNIPWPSALYTIAKKHL